MSDSRDPSVISQNYNNGYGDLFLRSCLNAAVLEITGLDMTRYVYSYKIFKLLDSLDEFELINQLETSLSIHIDDHMYDEANIKTIDDYVQFLKTCKRCLCPTHKIIN